MGARGRARDLLVGQVVEHRPEMLRRDAAGVVLVVVVERLLAFPDRLTLARTLQF